MILGGGTNSRAKCPYCSDRFADRKEKRHLTTEDTKSTEKDGRKSLDFFRLFPCFSCLPWLNALLDLERCVQFRDRLLDVRCRLGVVTQLALGSRQDTDRLLQLGIGYRLRFLLFLAVALPLAESFAFSAAGLCPIPVLVMRMQFVNGFANEMSSFGTVTLIVVIGVSEKAMGLMEFGDDHRVPGVFSGPSESRNTSIGPGS